MNNGLCKNCKFKTWDKMSLCNHPVIGDIIAELKIENDVFESTYTSARIRNEFSKRLKIKFAPKSWSVIECEGFKI